MRTESIFYLQDTGVCLDGKSALLMQHAELQLGGLVLLDLLSPQRLEMLHEDSDDARGGTVSELIGTSFYD